jgi:hypothetical protein
LIFRFEGLNSTEKLFHLLLNLAQLLIEIFNFIQSAFDFREEAEVLIESGWVDEVFSLWISTGTVQLILQSIYLRLKMVPELVRVNYLLVVDQKASFLGHHLFHLLFTEFFIEVDI